MREKSGIGHATESFVESIFGGGESESANRRGRPGGAGGGSGRVVGSATDPAVGPQYPYLPGPPAPGGGGARVATSTSASQGRGSSFSSASRSSVAHRVAIARLPIDADKHQMRPDVAPGAAGRPTLEGRGWCELELIAAESGGAGGAILCAVEVVHLGPAPSGGNRRPAPPHREHLKDVQAYPPKFLGLPSTRPLWWVELGLVGLRGLVPSSPAVPLNAPFVEFHVNGELIHQTKPVNEPAASDPNFFDHYIVKVPFYGGMFAPHLIVTVKDTLAFGAVPTTLGVVDIALAPRLPNRAEYRRISETGDASALASRAASDVYDAANGALESRERARARPRAGAPRRPPRRPRLQARAPRGGPGQAGS